MKGYSCQIVVDEALTWLDEKRDGDEPFFLNLWFNEPHAPIAAPDEIVSRYGGLDDQAAIYSGTIDNTDRAIGRLIAKLEKLGELENTIIIYASDNGSYRQERNGELRGQKGSQFEGGHRVPGIFYWKGGIPGGRVEDEPTGVVDLLPTLCGLIGIEKPAKVHLDGSDLTPMLTGSGKFKRHQPLFWMTGANMVLRMGDHTLFASGTARSPIDFKAANQLTEQIKQVLGDDLEKVLDGRDVKDLRNRLFNIGRLANPEADRLKNQLRDLFYFQESWIPELKKSELGRVQLYDLSRDLGQQNNIAKERPELAARLKEQATAIYRSVMADAPEWPAPEELAAAKKPQENTPARPAPGTSDNNIAKLLARIDKHELPEGYQGSRHQAYVDRVMAGLKPEQRARVGQLWKEKRRLQPKMENAGMSFVRILEYVARGEKLSAQPAPQPAAPLPQQKGKPVLSKIDPQGLNWHQWRGPEANGLSRTANPPLQWSEESNVKWKVAIEGQGNASPIIWGDKVFILSAINTGRVDPKLPKPEDQPERVFGIKYPNTVYKFEVICLDRNTGAEIWRQTAAEQVPHEGTHQDADFASASPTTDGQRLYCWFGSAGLYCYDLAGKPLWSRDLGKAYIGASLGEGCSPVIHQNKLVIVRDNARQSSIEVLDAKTGETVWKKNRDEPNAWATPCVVQHQGQTQVITAASNKIRSYNLDNGNIIWQCGGLTGNVSPCPVTDGRSVYCMSGYEGYSLMALPLDAVGDVTNSETIRWKRNRGTPYVPSPLLYDGVLYFTQSNQGILTSVEVATGDIGLERTRLTQVSKLYASPVGAAGRVYITGRNGKTLVIKNSNQFEVLATNPLDDEFNASPALAGKQMFLRGRKFLYCLEDSSPKTESNKSETKTGEKAAVHRLQHDRRSTFDAFTYLNRIPEIPYDEETPQGFSGRIFGRLANQEGRQQIKTPKGMDRLAYDGFKTFLRLEGSENTGNCAACHTPPTFQDLKSHVTVTGSPAKRTPTLRNLKYSPEQLEEILQQKIDASRLKREGVGADIDGAYASIRIDSNDIPGLVAFLRSLQDVPNHQFRDIILNSQPLDRSTTIDEP